MKIIIEVDCSNHMLDSLTRDRRDWFHNGVPAGFISFDPSYLQEDPTDNSFVIAKFLGARE